MNPSGLGSEHPRIVIVDSSKVTRRLIEKLIIGAVPEAEVLSFDTAAAALAACEEQVVDLVSSAISLPDMDGLTLARQIREHSPQRYIPIILISGEVQDRLQRRDLGDDVTDYFDKSQGFKALGAFVSGYVHPDESVTGHVLYVEDSRVVAVATRRVMERNGLTVTHVVSVEEALELVEGNLKTKGEPAVDVILTDVYLKGGLTGQALVEKLRAGVGLGRRRLPILVMTGDDNRQNQTALLKGGANDLVQKPFDEQILIKKLRFQLQVSQGLG